MKAATHDPSELQAIARRVLHDPASVLALVTLVRKTGSSYRQPGARLLVLRDGSTLGTISGGCLESELAAFARQMEQDGRRFAEHTIDTRPIFGCQGTITLWVERMEMADADWIACMRAVDRAMERREPITLVTGTAGGQPGPTRIADAVSPFADGGFVQRLDLRKRLVLIGAHADVASVLKLVQTLSWQGIQVVPGAQRSGWIATESRDLQVFRVDAEGLMQQLRPDPATAVVIMTHNLGRDLSYARSVLDAGFGYVGMLGSARRRTELFNHLMDLDDPALILAAEQLHCPIGLDVGSETQEQIALSIVAEVQAVFAGRSGGKLKDTTQPIHP